MIFVIELHPSNKCWKEFFQIQKSRAPISFFYRSCFFNGCNLSDQTIKKNTGIICNYCFVVYCGEDEIEFQNENEKKNSWFLLFLFFSSRPIKGVVLKMGAVLCCSVRALGAIRGKPANTQAKAHTFAFYLPSLFLCYNLSSLSLLSIWISRNFLLFHCCLPVVELAGMWENIFFLAQFDPFPVFVLLLFV